METERNCKSKTVNEKSEVESQTGGVGVTTKKPRTINDLPPEILEMILDYMDIHELDVTDKVNQNWQTVSNRVVTRKIRSALAEVLTKFEILQRECLKMLDEEGW
ncbi:unnamed protein product [Orchesella dallaii]|uniref:F-box domain-containing protein n=1 Tax=Orchesella dallaii TaxID=48710 RepID=A0ABP1PIY2_9HEXA